MFTARMAAATGVADVEGVAVHVRLKLGDGLTEAVLDADSDCEAVEETEVDAVAEGDGFGDAFATATTCIPVDL